jgi:predicted membrane protein
MKRWQIVFGIGLILLGLFALIDVLTGINLWGLVFPLILICIGVMLILRPRMAGREVQVKMPILGDLRKKGAWEVGNHDIWLLIGSIRLDFTDAVFLQAEPKIKLFGFVNDLKIILPEDVGLYLTSSAFVSEFKGPSDKEERILNPLIYGTPNYTNAGKRVRIEVLGFVSEIQVKPPLL